MADCSHLVVFAVKLGVGPADADRLVAAIADLPPGRYLSGTLILKDFQFDNRTIELIEAGSMAEAQASQGN